MSFSRAGDIGLTGEPVQCVCEGWDQNNKLGDIQEGNYVELYAGDSHLSHAGTADLFTYTRHLCNYGVMTLYKCIIIIIIFLKFNIIIVVAVRRPPILGLIWQTLAWAHVVTICAMILFWDFGAI